MISTLKILTKKIPKIKEFENWIKGTYIQIKILKKWKI